MLSLCNMAFSFSFYYFFRAFLCDVSLLRRTRGRASSSHTQIFLSNSCVYLCSVLSTRQNLSFSSVSLDLSLFFSVSCFRISVYTPLCVSSKVSCRILFAGIRPAGFCLPEFVLPDSVCRLNSGGNSPPVLPPDSFVIFFSRRER